MRFRIFSCLYILLQIRNYHVNYHNYRINFWIKIIKWPKRGRANRFGLVVFQSQHHFRQIKRIHYVKEKPPSYAEHLSLSDLALELEAECEIFTVLVPTEQRSYPLCLSFLRRISSVRLFPFLQKGNGHRGTREIPRIYCHEHGFRISRETKKEREMFSAQTSKTGHRIK